jgi:hypothetical protein
MFTTKHHVCQREKVPASKNVENATETETCLKKIKVGIAGKHGKSCSQVQVQTCYHLIFILGALISYRRCRFQTHSGRSQHENELAIKVQICYNSLS